MASRKANVRLTRRVYAWGILSLLLSSVIWGCEKNPTSAPVEPLPPSGLFIEYAWSDSVRLWWLHDTPGAEGFEVGIRPEGEGVETIELSAGARTFLGDGIDTTKATRFRVRASYGDEFSGYAEPAVVDPDILRPNSFFVRSVNDSVELSWNPPDYTQFDGFIYHRILQHGASWEMNETVEFDATGWERINRYDETAPDGEAPGDRLAYVLSTRWGDYNSAPLRSDDLVWSLPALQDHMTGGVREHDAGRLAFFDDISHVVIVTETAASTRLQVLEVRTAHPFWTEVARIEGDNGRQAGCLVDEDLLIVAHGAASGDSTAFITYSLPHLTSLWEADTDGVVADVWNAHTPGTVAVIENDASLVRIFDPTDGSRTQAIEFDNPVASLAFIPPSRDRLALAEYRDTQIDTECRVVLKESSDGTTLWESEWTPYAPLLGREGLVVSPTGAFIAMTVERRTVVTESDMSVQIFRTETGESIGTVPGRALTFRTDGSTLIVIDPDRGNLAAYSISADRISAPESFGRPNTQGGVIPAGENTLWTMHSDGWLRKWTLERTWTQSFAVKGLMPSEADVPRSWIEGLQ